MFGASLHRHQPEHLSSWFSPIFCRSIERQSCSILVVGHARQIISGIDVSCPTKEELLEGPESTGTQRINHATERDLQKKPLRARNGYELEVVWEYPRPIGKEVILREGYICIPAGDHLGKIAMHDANATSKVRHLRGKKSVGRGLSDQLVDGSAVPGARSRFVDRIR